jgi:hypothetical protein
LRRVQQLASRALPPQSAPPPLMDRCCSGVTRWDLTRCQAPLTGCALDEAGGLQWTASTYRKQQACMHGATRGELRLLRVGAGGAAVQSGIGRGP